MKHKILSLLTLLLCVCSGACADDDPTWSINTSSAASSNWTGNYLDNSITVSFEDTGSNTSYNSGYFGLGNNGDYNTNYVEVLSTRVITKIAFLIAANTNNKDCKPNLLGWEGSTAPSSATADFFQENSHSSVSSGYSSAVWSEFDVSSKSLNRVRLYRHVNATTVGGESKVGTSTQTIRVFGVKVWLAAATFSVTYDDNGATSGSVPTDAKSYSSGDEVTVLGNTGTLARTNYTWSGWNTKADGSGTDRAAGATFDISANTTLYAKWIPDAPSTPSFSPASGALNAGDEVTITSSLATTIYYGWTETEEAPAEYNSTTATDGAIVVTAPNDANKHYLYAYGSNVTGNSSVFHNTTAYTITVDNTAPTLSSSTPAASATNVAISGTIVLTMSEAIGAVDASKFSFNSGTVSTVSIDGEDNTKVNVAYTGLSYNTETTLTVAAGGISDLAGNGNAEFTLTFTTIQETVATPTFTVVGSAFQIACATDGATIHYTTDGSTPDTDSPTFTLNGNDLMTLPTSGTVKAYAVKTGATDSEVASQAITVPTPAATTGDLLMILQPDAIGSDDTYASGYSKGGYTMTSNASKNGIQLTDKMTGYPYVFKVASGTITITPPTGVTIKSIKIFAMKNSNKSTGTITAVEGDGYSPTSSVVLPRYTYYDVEKTSGVMSEIVINNSSLSAGAGFSFTISAQARLYVEVYGTDAATSESITPAYTYTTFIPSHNLDFTSSDKLTAYIATAANASSVTLTSVDKVPAGTPVVLRATETGSAIDVDVAATTDDVSDNLLKIGDGVTAIGGSGKYDYILMSDQAFHKVTSASALAAGKAYLHLDAAPAAAAGAPSILLIEDEENNATNLENLNSTDNAVKFFENGQLYILKNGITYDLLGRIVK